MSAVRTPRPAAGRSVGVALGVTGAEAGPADGGVSGRVVSSGAANPPSRAVGGVSVWCTA